MDPNRSIVYANNLLYQCSESGQSTDLETVISLYRKSIMLLPAHNPNLLPASSNLAIALVRRFRQSGQREDLDEAVLWIRKALELQPSSKPDRTRSLSDLAHVLHTRFDRWGDREDLDEAISLDRDVLNMGPAAHLHRSDTLDSLAVSLKARFKQWGRLEDLDEAISLHRDALHMRALSHIDRSASLNNLAAALVTRFDHSGRREDLDEAILVHRDVLKLRPDRAISLSNLAGALDTRFTQLGHRKDLDEAISLHRRALELLPEYHPNRPDCLSNIAVTLGTRFHQSEQYRDLDEAISFERDALELRPVPHPERSGSLINLAGFLHTRFQKLGEPEDLDEAVRLLRDALKLCHASHPKQSVSLNNLALTLKSRFDQSDRCEDLDEVISFHREALVLVPTPHPGRPASLNNLGIALSARFNKLGQREDLDEAVRVSYESINTLTSTHPSICAFSANLGKTFLDAYAWSHEAEYLDKAVAAFQGAVKCETAPVSVRFSASRAWAFGADFARHESALDAYHAAVELLPRLATLGLDLWSRQQALTSSSDGLAGDAAACAIRSGRYGEAVELLEEARAVWWSQALQLRTPMADLREVAPELETKLKRISLELEQGSLRDMSRGISDTSQKVMSMEQEAAHFHDLNDEWLSTLAEVRQFNGFQDFLRPKRLSSLQDAAVNGPVVILNTSMVSLTSDALILTCSGVRHVPLPDFSFPVVHTLVKLIQTATRCSNRNCLLAEADRTQIECLVQQIPPISDKGRHLKRVTVVPTQLDDIFRSVLAVLWESVVEPIIRNLVLQKSDDPLRLWWCPTGPFAFLPVHAAGIYNSEKTESVSDYVISSYTPTISALLSVVPLPQKTFKMTVIIQPQTPGQKSLPCTLAELRKIEDHAPNESLVRLLPGYAAEVISHLPSTSIAHFACHAQQDAQDPLNSALLLQDGELRVAQIMRLSMKGAALAFLSACETAMGDERLPDEVIHLGMTLLFAGFRGVVATIWSISDVDGPKIADTFYNTLFGGGASTAESAGAVGFDAARALHLAVRQLRDEGVDFVRWIPFVHLGR